MNDVNNDVSDFKLPANCNLQRRTPWHRAPVRIMEQTIHFDTLDNLLLRLNAQNGNTVVLKLVFYPINDNVDLSSRLKLKTTAQRPVASALVYLLQMCRPIGPVLLYFKYLFIFHFIQIRPRLCLRPHHLQ